MINPYGCGFSLRMTLERSTVDHQKSLAMKPCAGAVSLSFSWTRSFLRFSKTCSLLSFIVRGANIGRAFENKDKRTRSKALQWQTTERNIDIISFQKRNFLFFSFLTIVSTMPFFDYESLPQHFHLRHRYFLLPSFHLLPIRQIWRCRGMWSCLRQKAHYQR